MKLIRRKIAREFLGFKSDSTLHLRISQGLLTKPVKIGASSVWPESELDAINRARVAGLTDAQIRALVKQLEAARVSYRPELAA